ncbi:MAG: hypothetical protein ABIH26_10860, partial [Candidatus Eisenbacteria bacterium]
RIDHKKVSVARYPAQRPETAAAAGAREKAAGRLRFQRLQMNLTPDGGESEVTLEREKFHGFGRSRFTLSSDPARAVVEATLQAVAQFLREGSFQIGSVQRTHIGSHDAVFVQVDHVQSGRSIPLLGSALVSRDPNLTALLAALDAVNRYMGRLEPTTGAEFVAGPEPSSS